LANSKLFYLKTPIFLVNLFYLQNLWVKKCHLAYEEPKTKISDKNGSKN